MLTSIPTGQNIVATIAYGEEYDDGYYIVQEGDQFGPVWYDEVEGWEFEANLGYFPTIKEAAEAALRDWELTGNIETSDIEKNARTLAGE